MKKLLIGLALFFVTICLVMVWIVHSFNAEYYRKQIIDSLTQLTGRNVEIKGEVSLSWTPLPALVVSGLEVANQENSDSPVMLKVEQIRSEIEWKSLLSRPLIIKKVELKKPILLLERVKGTQTNFDFPKLFKTNLSQEDNLFLDNKTKLSLSMESVYLSDGTFIYDNKLSGNNFTVSQIDGLRKMDSLDGLFSLDGTAEIASKKMDFSLNFSKMEVAQPNTFSLEMTEQESTTNINVNGRFVQDLKNPENWLTLSIVLKSDKPNLFLKDRLMNWPAKAIVANATLDITARAMQINEFTLRQIEEKQDQDTSIYFGPEENKENGQFVFDVKNVDYDQWKDFLKTLPREKVFLDFSKEFRFQFENIQYKGEILPRGQGDIRLNKGEINLSNLSMELPFNSSVSIDGVWGVKENNGALNVQLQSAELKSLLKWGWGLDLNEFPEQVLKTLQLTGKWNFSNDKDILNIKAAVLDEIQYVGSVESSKGDIKLVGKLDGLNLGSYFPQKDIKQVIKKIPSNLFVSFDLNGNGFVFGDLIVEAFNLKGLVKEGVLNLESLALKTEEGISLNGNIQLENITTDLTQIKNFRMDFETPEKTNLYEKLKSTFLWPEISGDMKGKVSYTALKDNTGEFDFTAQIGDLNFSSEGKIISILKDPRIEDGHYSIKYPNIQEFLSNFENLKDIFPYLKGNLDLKFDGKRGQDHFQIDNFSFSSEKQTLQGKGYLDLDSKKFDLNVSTSVLNLENFIPSDLNSFRIKKIPDWRGTMNLRANQVNYHKKSINEFQTRFILEDKKIDIPTLSFQLPGNSGKVVSEGNLDLNSLAKVSGKLSVANFVLDKRAIDFTNIALSDGKLNLSGEFTTSGDSLTVMQSNLNGKGNFVWNGGFIEGIDLAETSSKISRLLQGNQPIDVISAAIKQSLLHSRTPVGDLKGDFQIQKGLLSVNEMVTQTRFGEILIDKVNCSIPKNELNADLSIQLPDFKDAPALDLSIQKNKITLKTASFEKAIQTKILKQEEKVKKQEEERAVQEAKENQAEIQQTAQEILIQSEKQIQELKNKYTLNPSESAKSLLEEAEQNAKDIRQLSVQSELSLSEYNSLKEKAKLLTLQVQEMDQTQLRQDVLSQKENIKKIIETTQDKLTDIGRIYRRNSTSSILAVLLQKSQEEAEKIQGWWGSIQKTQKIEEALDLSKKIDDSFQKIQKAWNYANQIERGVVPSSNVSGTIDIIEE